MKQDVGPLPDVVPKKRRQLMNVPDVHLAQWLSEAHLLTPSERRRLSEEKARRKTENAPEFKLGLVVGREGMTPQQLAKMQEMLNGKKLDGVHWVKGSHKFVRKLHDFADIPIGTHADLKEVVRAATVVFAAPKEPERPGKVEGVWEAVRFAKHRRLPVKVIMPNGEEK